VTVYIPRRNGGHIIFGAWRKNDDDEWYLSTPEPTSKKDKILSFAEAVFKYTRKPKTTKLKVIK